MNHLGDVIRRRLRSYFVLVLAGIVLAAQSWTATAQEGEGLSIEPPSVILRDVPFEVAVKDPSGQIGDGGAFELRVGEQVFPGVMEGGQATVEGVLTSDPEASFILFDTGGAELATASGGTLPGWTAVLPALIAIVIALALRQVIPALFLGIWIGGALVYGFSLSGIWNGFLDTVSTYVLNALNDSGHLSVILFSLLIGGMVGIISKNGGTRGIVNAVIGWASSPKRGQLTTSVLGVAIFFDDYANTLIVGNTMRPITDRLRISREKLAYIVDSTAAPVATLALVTTWIGFQVGLIDEAVGKIEGYDESAYSIFLNSIAYNFYPVLAIFFVFLVAWTGRDFGPMATAEHRARTTGEVSRLDAHSGDSPEEEKDREPHPDKPMRAINAVAPVVVLVIATLIGIYVTGRSGAGEDASLRDIIGNGDSYAAMIWASLIAVAVAAIMSLAQRILTVVEVVDAWYAGARSMLLAIVILTLAWSLAGVNEVLHTGDYLVSTLGDTLSPRIIPLIVFVLSGVTAFATGSSWGVMGIMMPLVIPLSWTVMANAGMNEAGEGLYLFYASVSAVLAGAVWGDHCSPISDTTILSSLATGCDHIDHVRTQIPYAVLVGAVAMGLGLLPASYGVPWWIVLPVGVVALVGVLRLIGTRADDAPATSSESQLSSRTV